MPGTFSNPRDPEGNVIRTKIKEWLLFYDSTYENAVFTIEDVPCIDVGCPDRETLITIEQHNNSDTIRIRKPLVYIRKWDIEFAVHQKKNRSRA